jgi:hypothetical protein
MSKNLLFSVSIAALVGLVATFSWAQIRTSGQNATPKTASPLIFKTFTPAPTLQYLPNAANNMTGWIKVTAGATNGNPTLLPTTNGYFLIGRGGDNAIYGAPIDIQNPQTIDSTSWKVLVNSYNSGITCNANRPNSWANTTKWSRCYGLGPNGSAVVTEFPSNSDGSPGDNQTRNFGGQNAGGLPMGISFDLQFPNARTVSVITVMADNGLWLHKMVVTAWNSANSPTIQSSWEKIPNQVVGSAASCILVNPNEVYCAFRSVNNFVRLLTLTGTPSNRVEDLLSNTTSWNNSNILNSPPATSAANQPLTSAPSIVKHPNNRYSIMIRDFDGSLKRITYNSINKTWGSWIDEGGYLNAGSQPTCVADGFVPVCLIQGPDGGAYIKRLPAIVAGL